MTLKDWLFETGDFINPYYAGQWKMLHIISLTTNITLREIRCMAVMMTENGLPSSVKRQSICLA